MFSRFSLTRHPSNQTNTSLCEYNRRLALYRPDALATPAKGFFASTSGWRDIRSKETAHDIPPALVEEKAAGIALGKTRFPSDPPNEKLVPGVAGGSDSPVDFAICISSAPPDSSILSQAFAEQSGGAASHALAFGPRFIGPRAPGRA
jgi:hypothetical protein